MKFNVKKVIDHIYSFDFKDTVLVDGDEVLANEEENEFANALTKRDFDKGIIVSPRGYKNGLIYKSTNGGEFYNNPIWLPEIVTFYLNLYGLKKDHFYKITVKGRNTHKYNRVTDITDDRKIEIVSSEKERVLFEDLSEVFTNEDFVGIFRATSVEENLFFRMGKIYLNNISIDEIEVLDESKTEEESLPELTMEPNKNQMISYGIFSGKLPNFSHGKNAEVQKLSGKGINLYLDKESKIYTIERDNANDIIGLPLSNITLYYDINLNKCPGVHLEIIDVSEKMSPNTVKQGYIAFKLVDSKGQPVLYSNEYARLYVFINKLS